LSLDSSLGEVIDDPDAWAVTLQTIRSHMPAYRIGDIGQNGALNMPLRRLFQFGEYPNRDQLLAALQSALQSVAPGEGTEGG
jgi:hypothetical protein